MKVGTIWSLTFRTSKCHKIVSLPATVSEKLSQVWTQTFGTDRVSVGFANFHSILVINADKGNMISHENSIFPFILIDAHSTMRVFMMFLLLSLLYLMSDL